MSKKEKILRPERWTYNLLAKDRTITNGCLSVADWKIVVESIRYMPHVEVEDDGEVLFETRARIAHRLRRLFRDAKITGVDVIVPSGFNKHITIAIVHQVHNSDAGAAEWYEKTRKELNARIEELVYTSYPSLRALPDLLVFKR